MPNDYFMGLIIDNTYGETVDDWINKTIRTALGANGKGELPEELADLFSTSTINIDGETRVVVDWA